MQELLPRELRDMIYAHLLGDPYIIPCHITSQYETDEMDKKYPTRSALSQYPHVGDIEYVGRDTKTELAESWYALSRFHLSSHADVNELLDHDIWDVGLEPRMYVRQVHAVLDPGDYLPGSGEIPNLELDLFLPRDFDRLTELKAPASIMIRFNLQDWYYERVEYPEMERYMCMVTEYLFPILSDMLSVGITVTVTVGVMRLRNLSKEDLDLEKWCHLALNGRSTYEEDRF
jgi:hypothetical protein